MPLKLYPFHPDPKLSLGGRDAEAVFSAISSQLSSLDLTWEPNAEERTGRVVSHRGNVWSRAYRRAKQRGELPDAASEMELGVEVAVLDESLSMIWRQGLDKDHFESFYTLLTRTMHDVKLQ